MKKAFTIENLEAQVNKKIKYYLDSYSPDNALIIFDHGLGDAIEFFSIFNTLKKDYPKWNFKFGFHPTLGFKSLHQDSYEIKELNDNYVIPYGQSIVQSSNTLIRYNLDKLTKKFKFIFCIQFPDSRHPSMQPHQVINISKINRCKVMEVGYDDNKILESYTPPFMTKLNNEDSKIVIYHVGGHTDKGIKNPSEIDQLAIWNEIKDAGFIPMDVHMNNASTIINANIPLPPFIDPELSIRNSGGNLDTLINTMLTAKYLVGVLSGPLHLGNVLYGSENCLGLEGHFKIHNYIDNTNLETTPIYPYKKGSVYNWLKNKG